MMRRIPRAELTREPSPVFREPVVAALEHALADHAAHAQALARAERDIVDITQRAVATLVQAELTLRPEHIRTLVQNMVQEVRAARQITVHVHPADRALLPSVKELAQRAEAQGMIEIIDDLSLSRGDCMLTSTLGDIDGRIETKLAHLQQLLTQQTRP